MRNLRQGFNIAMSVKSISLLMLIKKKNRFFKEIEAYIKRLARVENISYLEIGADVPKNQQQLLFGLQK